MNQPNISKDFACCHRKYLPCRFSHLDGDVHRCSYDRLWVLAKWINQDEETAKSLVNQACPPIRDEDNLSKFLAKIHKEYANDVIKNANIGDTIFCFDETNGEVTLLEKPVTDTGLCVYKTATEEIRSKPVKLFRTISQGNYAAEYLIEGEKSEIESLMIKRMALESGFRVEIQKTDSGHMVKIFGDNQREVDDFMTLCVYNKFIIY